jgi:hypothetical protein
MSGVRSQCFPQAVVPHAGQMDQEKARRDGPTLWWVGGAVPLSKGLLYKVTGKFARRTGAQSIDVSDRLPAGGLLSTVDDMMRFAIALHTDTW